MKKLLKEPSFWIVSIEIIIAVVLGFLGFKITYNPNLDNNWNAVSAVAAWAGAIGTVAILIYNHIAIKLTQQSVKQAIDLQLYDKRQAAYDEIFTNKAFIKTPENIKILFSDEIYSLHKKLTQLCEERRNLIYRFIGFRIYDRWDIESLYNTCKPTVDKMIDFLIPKIKSQRIDNFESEEQINSNLEIVEEIKLYTEEIENNFQKLKTEMEQFIKESIGNI